MLLVCSLKFMQPAKVFHGIGCCVAHLYFLFFNCSIYFHQSLLSKNISAIPDLLVYKKYRTGFVFTPLLRTAKVGKFCCKTSINNSTVNCSLSQWPISAITNWLSASKNSWYFISAVIKISAPVCMAFGNKIWEAKW